MIPLALIAAFATEDQSRYVLSRPRVVGEMLAATDGRVLVEVPVSEVEMESLEIPEGKFPNYAKILYPAFEADLGSPVILPEMPPQPADFITDCPECRGSGIVECNYGHDHECGNCDKTGKVTNFEKWTIRASEITLGGYYVDKVLKLPNLQWFAPSPAHDGMRFTFGERGKGLLMPMRKERA